MFNNVLVGVDGRQGGRDAIALAGQLAAPGARLTLAHVDPVETTDGAYRIRDSHNMLSDERAGAGIDAKIFVVHGPSVAHALHQLMASRHCDLLVLGACHRDAIGRRVAGDHTILSLKNARCAVAIAPPGHAPVSGISRVGVGWDGSPEAAQALEAARAIAAKTGATIEPLVVLSGRASPTASRSSTAGRLSPSN